MEVGRIVVLVVWAIVGPLMLLHKLFWFIRYGVYCLQGRQDSTYVARNMVYLLINAGISALPLLLNR